MKKLSYLLLFCVAVLFASCSSCSNNKNENVDPLDVPTVFEENLTEADTSKVKEIIAVYMTHIQKGEYYDAAGMVYRHEMQQGKKVPRLLDNDEIERLVNVYKLFPVEDYKIDYMRFREKELNEVCISVVMQKGKNGAPDAISKMFFNPIYFHNKWCLVLDDSHQGTDAFVPAVKRDSMRNVYKNSNASKKDVTNNTVPANEQKKDSIK